MFEKTKTFNWHKAAKKLTDVRIIGSIAFGIIAVLVTWSGVKVIQSNYDLQKQINAMQQANDVKKLANENLKLKNQYLNTDGYLELAARRHFNKAAPGEKLLIVPKEVAMAHTVEPPKVLGESTSTGSSGSSSSAASSAQTTDTPSVEDAGPWYERNFNAWLEFLFHQSS